ncbi:MAG: hypothetical protein ACRDTE_30115, partial [Pseudonocardiaceae bacterium]
GGLAQRAATAIEQLEPPSGDRLARAGDEIDALLRQLLRTLFAENWSHGVKPAVHAALVGRYYERFADIAVTVARQVGTLATERMQSRQSGDTAQDRVSKLESRARRNCHTHQVRIGDQQPAPPTG